MHYRRGIEKDWRRFLRPDGKNIPYVSVMAQEQWRTVVKILRFRLSLPSILAIFLWNLCYPFTLIGYHHNETIYTITVANMNWSTPYYA